MSIFDGLLARFGYAKTQQVQQPAPWLLATAEAERWNIPDGSRYTAQAALYQRLSWVQIAVQTLAQSGASVRLAVKSLRGEQTREIINHPFELLMQRPNPLMSRFEFLEATFAYRALTGNAFWWLNRSNEREDPAELWIIPSDRITPVPDGHQFLRGYLYDAGTALITLEPWEVVHFRRFHPTNMYVGLSPVEALVLTGEGDLGMQKTNAKIYNESGGKLPGILAFADNIADPEWERMKADLRDKANKRDLMMLRNVKSGGVQWLQATMSRRDMEFIEGRRMNRQEIFDLFAPGLFTMISENATEANSRTGKATFAELALWPMLQAVQEKISLDVLPAYESPQIRLRAEFDDVRVADRQLQLQEQQEYSRTHTVDEVRKKYYQDDALPDERGELMIAQINPSTGVPTAQDAGQQPDAMQPMPMQDNSGEAQQMGTDSGPGRRTVLKAWERFAVNRLRAGKAQRMFDAPELDEADAQRIFERVQECKTVEDLKKIFNHETHETHEKKSAGRDAKEPGRAQKVAFEKRLAAIVQQMFAGQAERIQARLATITPAASKADPLAGFDADFEDETALAELIRLLTEATRNGIALFGQRTKIGFDPSLTNTQAAAWAKSYAYKLIKNINTVTQAALQQAISAFADTAGMTVGDVMAALPFDEQRALLVATTEITRAYAQANELAGKQLQKDYPGVQVVKTWFTNNDDLVCEICGPLDGQTADMDTGFGDAEMGIPYPPAHPGCRCWMETSTQVTP